VQPIRGASRTRAERPHRNRHAIRITTAVALLVLIADAVASPAAPAAHAAGLSSSPTFSATSYSRQPLAPLVAPAAYSPTPLNLTHPIAAANGHSFAIKSDGTVWTWGNQAIGLPGNGTNTGGTSLAGPTPAPTSAFGSIVSLAGADVHAVALRPDGTVWAWGDDQYGTVGAGGSGDTTCGSVLCATQPIQVSSPGPFIAVASGFLNSYALKWDGTVWAWGDNRVGALGIGTRNGPESCFVSFGHDQWCSRTPVQVSGLTGVIAIAAGAYFGMALKGDGTVWVWGDSEYGPGPNGLVPTKVPSLSNIIALAATTYPFGSTAVALRSDGTVWTWGGNSDGQLGNGSCCTGSTTPVQVSSLTGVVAIAGGWEHILALKSDGTVWGWGYNGDGELGNGATRDKFTPVRAGTLTNVVSIAATDRHSMAAKADGTVWTWGLNTWGQLGDGTTTTRTSPVQSLMTGVPAPAPFVLQQQPLAGGAIGASETLGGNNPCYVCSLGQLAAGYVGKPVNTAFGNMTDTAADVAIPGRGFSLRFLRTYNSLTAASSGPLGYGWTSSVGVSLSQPGGTGPVSITQESGSQVVFNQSGSTYTPAAPRLNATLTQNGDGTWTFVRSARETFTFSATGLLTAEQDLNGYTTTLAYNGSSQLTTITDESGRSLSIGWSGSHIVSLTDSNVSPPRSVTLQYNDGAGNLTDVIGLNGGHSRFTYDANHRMTNMYDPICFTAGATCNSGNGVVNMYDGSNRVTSQTDNLGRTTTFVYSGDPTSSVGSTTTTTDPKGNIRKETYQYGVRTAVTYGYGTAQAASWRYRYDPTTGALISVTDPNNGTTTYIVDGRGNWLSRTDSLGRLTQRTYNSFDEPLTEVDPLGVTTTNTYDGRANLTSVSRPLLDGSGQVIATRATQYNYTDPSHPGDLITRVDPDGKTWTYGYDTYGNRNASTDPLGNTTSWTFNIAGWMLTTVSPRGNVSGCNCAAQYTTTYGYVDTISGATNAFGDVATVTDPLGHVTANHYDANRNVTSITDADGNPESYVFDLENERTQIVRADGTVVRTDYNPDGSVSAEKDGKNNAILSFGYDSLARVTTKTDALGNVTTFAYDAAGNLLSQQAPGGNCAAVPATSCATRTYDAGNQLTSITYSDGSTPNVSAIGYDADGQRLAMTDGTGSSSWSWDSLHRLTSYSNGNGDQIQYQYNLRSLITQITYPGNHAVIRGYDDASRWTSVQDWLGNSSTFGYDPDSNLTSRTLPSSTGVVDTATFSAAQRLSSISDAKGASTVFAASYGRDGLGQVSSDSSLPSGVSSDRYNALNQLCYAGSTNGNACSSPPGGAQTYGYDAADNLVGNRGLTQAFNAADALCWTVSGPSANACSTPPTGATRYSYDTRGNRTTVTPASGSVTNLGFNLADELKSWGQGATTIATYSYNGDGLRMSKTVSGASTRFTWDVSGQIPLLIGDGATQYVYGPGNQPLEQIGVPAGITLVGTASASGKSLSLTLTLPAGSQPGDEVYVASTQPSTTTVTPPSGYVAVTSVTSTGSSPLAKTTVYRHTVVAGETSAILTYSTKTTTQAVVLGVYHGVDVSLPVDVYSSASGAGTTSVTAPSVTTNYPGEQLLAFHGSVGSFTSSAAWTAPTGMTERKQVNPGSTSIGLADQALVAAGATGTRGSSFSSSANLTTVLIGVPVRPILYFHLDQLGSVRALTDGTGAVRGTFTYDPYGTVTSSTGTWTTPFGFAGEYRDTETGFIYLRARYYDPATAQFINRDPVTSMTRQPYGYTYGNPLNAIDPTGLFCLEFWDASKCDNLLTDILSSSHTVGVCASETGGAVVGQVVEVCGVVRFDGAVPAGFGTTQTVGAGAAVGGRVTGFLSLQFSNAPRVCDLGSWFTYFNAGAGAGPAVGVGGAVGVSGSTVVGVTEVSVGVGGGASGQVGESYTWTQTWLGQ
jgi:RHS repeat-associated protein